MKTTVQLIQYYTRKVAQYGAIHPSKPRPKAHKHRHARLMAYKVAMHRRIELEKQNPSYAF
ncbi:hypothetical protein PMI08_01593 [Brevibacillus sp. CF112]|nr:hypothetical protein PMI08_01593 [Brevibacillus sp. CF112]